jgi:hypothetical protein
MLLRVWRFITLLLAALALTMESAHVLELPQKMRYDVQSEDPQEQGVSSCLLASVGCLSLGSSMP